MALDEALRRASIGGSDIAAILNIDDYRDPYSLWVLKTGRAEAEPPTSRMLLGKAFERGILEFYANTTGRELRYLDITEQHPTRPWMVYTPDAVCVHEPRGVDAKLVSLDQRFRWGATSDEIPPRIQAQCWWYMAAMDFPLWDVAAVLTTGDPLFYTVERDMDLEAAMLEAAEEYWRRFLCGDEVPTPGATLATTNYLKRAYPQHFGAKP